MWVYGWLEFSQCVVLSNILENTLCPYRRLERLQKALEFWSTKQLHRRTWRRSSLRQCAGILVPHSNTSTRRAMRKLLTARLCGVRIRSRTWVRCLLASMPRIRSGLSRRSTSATASRSALRTAAMGWSACLRKICSFFRCSVRLDPSPTLTVDLCHLKTLRVSRGVFLMPVC